MGGFSNDEFKTFCQNLNIKICTPAAKSPWSNNLVERHDVWLKLIVCKTIEEINCDLDLAVAWALSAKNSLKNGNGFSPRSTCIWKKQTFQMFLQMFLVSGDLLLRFSVTENLSALDFTRKKVIIIEAYLN